MSDYTKARLTIAVVLLGLYAVVAFGQVTNLMNTGLRVDSNGALMVTAAAFSGTQGPVTNAANLGVKTDTLSQLIVTLGGGGTAAVVSVGTGTQTATLGGTMSVNTTSTSTTGLIEETLMQFSLPANTLSTTGRGVRLTVAGNFAANANTKTIRVYFGATILATSQSIVAAPNALSWSGTYTVFRTSPTAQFASGTQTANGNLTAAAITTPAETLSGAVIIKITGDGPTTIGDISARLLMVEAI